MQVDNGLLSTVTQEGYDNYIRQNLLVTLSDTEFRSDATDPSIPLPPQFGRGVNFSGTIVPPLLTTTLSSTWTCGEASSVTILAVDNEQSTYPF